MSLTEKLIALRKQKGLTQLDLAERLHVSRQAISRWEVGIAVPSTDNLKFLSELYEVSVDYLLYDSVEHPSSTVGLAEDNPAKQPPEVPPQAERKRKHSYIFIYVLGIALVFLIGIVIGMTAIPQREKAKVTSIKDMANATEDNYPTITFSIK